MPARDEIRVTVVKYPDRKNLIMRYVDPLTGRQVSRSTGTTSRREAERTAAKWEAELRSGQAQSQRQVEWAAFRDRYEGDVLPGLAQNTGNLVGTSFNAVEEILRPKYLRDLNADRLSYFQARLRDRGLAEPTIRTYLAHLLSALKWAATLSLIAAVPRVQRPKRVKKSKLMKGRPITSEEFERMLAKTAAVVGTKASDSWEHLLRGLWWSGLRLSEALAFYWDRDDRLRPALELKHPMLIIPGELEKGNKDRLLPMAPEFARFLASIPVERRRGATFPLVGKGGKVHVYTFQHVSKTICRIGQAAGVKVHTEVKSSKVKFASAHDLRRSFGERWARKVMPQVLKELMRHESIETTMKYYVGINAEMTADVLWQAFGQSDNAPLPGFAQAGDSSNSVSAES